MTTREEMIETVTAENPIIRIGDDEKGYVDASADEKSKLISQWADIRLADEAKAAADKAEADKAEADKLAAQAKLAALGLTADDLKALGL